MNENTREIIAIAWCDKISSDVIRKTTGLSEKDKNK
jgi:hypothetical protein